MLVLLIEWFGGRYDLEYISGLWPSTADKRKPGMDNSVSVIIPFYEGVEWLCEAVESVLNQTYAVSEIIVVNDGSRESVEYFLEKYGEKIIYIYKENGGPASARNMGIERSTGKFIAFLDSDDLWLPRKLELQIFAMKSKNAVWSHTGYETFDTLSKNKDTVKRVSISEFSGDIFPKMLYFNPLATPGIVIDGELLRNNINWRFNKDMRYGQDQYLWMCIAPKHEILAIDEVLVRVRMRGNNAALRARVQLRAKAIIYDNILKGNREYLGQLSFIGKSAFGLCICGEKILTFFEKKTEKNTVILENISRCLYILPWCMFKIAYIYCRHKE
jgi:teichuronic acid biosynthesis glycosyltransferase TuaG